MSDLDDMLDHITTNYKSIDFFADTFEFLVDNTEFQVSTYTFITQSGHKTMRLIESKRTLFTITLTKNHFYSYANLPNAFVDKMKIHVICTEFQVIYNNNQVVLIFIAGYIF